MSKLPFSGEANVPLQDEERAYLLQRAADHARPAERAADTAMQAIHMEFQRRYEERASLIAVVATN